LAFLPVAEKTWVVPTSIETAVLGDNVTLVTLPLLPLLLLLPRQPVRATAKLMPNVRKKPEPQRCISLFAIVIYYEMSHLNEKRAGACCAVSELSKKLSELLIQWTGQTNPHPVIGTVTQPPQRTAIGPFVDDQQMIVKTMRHSTHRTGKIDPEGVRFVANWRTVILLGMKGDAG